MYVCVRTVTDPENSRGGAVIRDRRPSTSSNGMLGRFGRGSDPSIGNNLKKNLIMLERIMFLRFFNVK